MIFTVTYSETLNTFLVDYFNNHDHTVSRKLPHLPPLPDFILTNIDFVNITADYRPYASFKGIIAYKAWSTSPNLSITYQVDLIISNLSITNCILDLQYVFVTAKKFGKLNNTIFHYTDNILFHQNAKVIKKVDDIRF